MKNLLYIFFILTGVCAKAQDVPDNSSARAIRITTTLDSFRLRLPVEKVHIQFDKPYYTLGDTIWMKAYVVNESNQLSALSKTLYIDLVNDNDSTKTSFSLPITSGLAWGTITLSDSVMRMGNYHIFAYTNAMRSWPSEYFFSKAISIGDALPPFTGTNSASTIVSSPVIKKPDVMVKLDTAISVRFFPEGGELVNGLASKIAVKAIGTDGLSRTINGYIIDQNKVKITDFSSENAGMGSFTLKPVAGASYTAVIKLRDSIEKRIDLPKAINQGYTLSVSQTAKDITVTINASRTLLNTGEILLMAQANNTVYYSGKKRVINTGFSTTLPKSRFPGGIVQFTLFSPENKPVAERLVFVRQPEKHLNLEITAEKENYKPREKVHLDLQVMDEDGKPITGAFSVAITDEGKVPVKEADEKTIFSNLLLTADLKGFIEHPNYYFTNVNADKDRQLDNLLLTQGWRRFEWSNILADKLPEIASFTDDANSVSGRVLTNKNVPVPGAKVFLLFNTGDGIVIDTVADAQGRFSFNNLILKKDVSFNVSATNNKKQKNLKVEIFRKNDTPVTFPPLPEDHPLVENMVTYLQSSRTRFNEMQNAGLIDRSIRLKEVTINDTRKTVRDIALEGSVNRTGPADNVLTFVDLAHNSPTLQMGLRFNLIGVHINPDPKSLGFSISYEGAGGVIVVNGMHLTSAEIGGITPDMISGIEVIKGGRAGAYRNPRSTVIPTIAMLITLKSGGVDYQKYIDESDENQHLATNKVKMLKEVAIKERKEDKVRELALQYSITQGRTPDQVLTFVDLANCGSLQGCLASKVLGLRFYPKTDGTFTVGWAGFSMPIYIEHNIPLSALNPNMIAGVEIIKRVNPGIFISLKKSGIDYKKYIDEAQEEAHMTDTKAKLIKDSESNANKQKKILEFALQKPEGTVADQLLTFLDLSDCTSIGECLTNKLTGIRIAPQPDGSFNAFYDNTKMGILLDGKMAVLPVIDPEKVAAIEVVKGPRAAAYLPIGSKDTTNNLKGGLLIITSKKQGVNYKKYIDEQQEEKLASSSKSVLLNEIVIKAKKDPVTIMNMAVKNSSNLAGAGHADQVLTFIDLLPCGGNLMQCLSGRLTNVIIGGDGKAYSRGFDAPMYVVIDGIGDRDPTALSTNEVASVEVLRGGGAAALYGVKAANGVLIITTKKGDVDYTAYEIEHYQPRDSNKPKAMVKYHFQGGYDARREFYSPDYDNPATDKQQADLRTTIYWKPNIITDGNGRASIEFFNADGTGNYRVITEGLDKDGKLGRQVFKYAVK